MTDCVAKLQAPNFDVHLIRTNYGNSLARSGSVSLKKIAHLILAILKTWTCVLERRPAVLYYCPAGRSSIPLVRDAIYLWSTRWLFPTVVLHFHAGGSSELLATTPTLLRRLLLLGIGQPEVGIKLSERSPADPEYLNAKQVIVVPNGIAEHSTPASARGPGFRVSYISLLTPSKGVFDLVKAFGALRQLHADVFLDVIGEFHSDQLRTQLEELIASYSLNDNVIIHGQQVGSAKYQILQASSVYCFPSYFEHENLPVSIIEAMSVGLPVVATRWRAIPELVVDGETGILVDTGDLKGLVQALNTLYEDGALLSNMGTKARTRFENHYRLERFEDRIIDVFDDILQNKRTSRSLDR